MERKNVNAVQPNTDTLRGIKRRIIVLLSFFVNSYYMRKNSVCTEEKQRFQQIS